MSMIEVRSEINYPFTMVPHQLEKMKLDPYSYRVYQRILYRANGPKSQGHFESQENMSKEISISPREIRRKIKLLEGLNMIKVEKRGRNRDGHFMTNLITLLDLDKWGIKDNIETSVQIHHGTHSPTAGGLTVPPREDSQSDITRYQFELDLILTNAAEKQPAAKKKGSQLRKKKTWEEKSEEERMDSVLNMTCDAHRLALEKDRRVTPYPFNDIPDLLNPLIKLHGLEAIKSFLDKRRDEKRGCNVRILGLEILRGVDDKLDKPEPILEVEKRQEESQEKSFPDKVIQQMERNMSYDKKIIDENKDLVLEGFPQEVKDWYGNISDSKFKRSVHKEFKMMSREQFTAFVASILNRNKKSDLDIATNSSISLGMG